MTAKEYKESLRVRTYTYSEVLRFAEYYSANRKDGTAAMLLTQHMKSIGIKEGQDLQSLKVHIIEREVCDFYGLSLEQVRGKYRYLEYVTARMMICYFAVKHASERKVAELCYMDRDSVHYRKTKAAELLGVKHEKELRADAEYLGRLFEAKFNELNVSTAEEGGCDE